MRYKHTQIGRVMIWAVLLASVVVAIGTISQPSRLREISVVISLLLLVTIPLFYKLTIELDDQTLRASFGIGLIKKKVPLDQIAACESIRTRWWYGWGIHLTPYGWLYNVSGLHAVAITLRNGRKLALGTDDPDGLVAAIQRLIGPRNISRGWVAHASRVLASASSRSRTFLSASH
jgi:hypothetical protein